MPIEVPFLNVIHRTISKPIPLVIRDKDLIIRAYSQARRGADPAGQRVKVPVLV